MKECLSVAHFTEINPLIFYLVLPTPGNIGAFWRSLLLFEIYKSEGKCSRSVLGHTDNNLAVCSSYKVKFCPLFDTQRKCVALFLPLMRCHRAWFTHDLWLHVFPHTDLMGWLLDVWKGQILLNRVMMGLCRWCRHEECSFEMFFDIGQLCSVNASQSETPPEFFSLRSLLTSLWIENAV